MENLEKEVKNQEILDYLGQMNGPVPGQSLTNNPDEPYPWEKPSTYTTMNEAMHGLFDMLTEEEMYIDVVSAIGQGMPIVNLTEVILTDGFQKGAWNPDLMVQLIEPTMYMLMSMAEKAGVKYKIDDEDDPDIEEATPEEELEMFKGLTKIAEDRIRGNKKPAQEVLPREIAQQIEKIEVPESLLSKPTEPIATETNNSLLAAPSQQQGVM
tara:strand:+ start:1198 stop:1830 length:633 start_codon:yes stop_codon:yes gene_type:complete